AFLAGMSVSLSAREGFDRLVRRRRLDVLVEPLPLAAQPPARAALAGLALAADDEHRRRCPGGDRLTQLAERALVADPLVADTHHHKVGPLGLLDRTVGEVA